MGGALWGTYPPGGLCRVGANGDVSRCGSYHGKRPGTGVGRRTWNLGPGTSRAGYGVGLGTAADGWGGD